MLSTGKKIKSESWTK